MKKIFSIFICAVLLSLVLSACADKTLLNPDDVKVPDGYTPFIINDSLEHKTQGYGVQIDTHMYKNYNNLTAEELNLYYERAIAMNVQNIRTQVFPEWYERANDNGDYNNFDYNSPNVDMNSAEMSDLWRLLEFCQENNILVDLSFYGCNSIYRSQNGKVNGSWLGAPFTTHWVTAPKLTDGAGNVFPGYEEYAESVYGLLNYIANVKKFTCVNEFSIYPEPNLSFVLADGKVSHLEFVKLIKIIDTKLKAEGIRQKFIFSGPASATSTITGYAQYVNDLAEVFDKFTASTYKFDGKDSDETFRDFAEGMAATLEDTGKSIGIAEFGTKNYVDPANQTDIDTYERAMYLARYMIELTNQGFTDMKYWVLGDVMYGDFLMRLGLWKFRDYEFAARPQYYTWSLICKYSDVGSSIYPIESAKDGVCMTSLKLPNGKWSYFMANSSNSDVNVSMVNYSAGYPKSLKVYEVRELLCDGSAELIPATQTLSIKDGAINYKLKRNSFAVLSDK